MHYINFLPKVDYDLEIYAKFYPHLSGELWTNYVITSYKPIKNKSSQFKAFMYSKLFVQIDALSGIKTQILTPIALKIDCEPNIGNLLNPYKRIDFSLIDINHAFYGHINDYSHMMWSHCFFRDHKPNFLEIDNQNETRKLVLMQDECMKDQILNHILNSHASTLVINTALSPSNRDLILELIEKSSLQKLKIKIKNKLELDRIFDALSKNTHLQVFHFIYDSQIGKCESVLGMVCEMLKINTTLVELVVERCILNGVTFKINFNEELKRNRLLLLWRNNTLMKIAAKKYASLNEKPPREIIPEEVYEEILRAKYALRFNHTS